MISEGSGAIREMTDEEDAQPARFNFYGLHRARAGLVEVHGRAGFPIARQIAPQDRLVGDRFDLIQNYFSIARILRVDQNNSCVRDKHGRVAAHACFLPAAGDDVQRILYFLEADRAWILLRPRDRDGERANSEQDSQYSQPFHARIIVRQ